MEIGLHISVLMAETLDGLAVRSGGVYVDGTLGRAGHALEVIRRGGRVLGIDCDAQALAESAERVARAGFRVAGTGADGEWDLRTVHGRHGDLAGLVRAAGFAAVDGILLDLGVSSPQLDEAGRGFSFRLDGPLDMRMDRSRGPTAAEVVATAPEEELRRIIGEFGEEPAAGRIAKAICAARERKAIATTVDLAAVVERAVGRFGARHPATRTFQALRMAVNDEAGNLARALEGGLRMLKPGGRFVVITFESLSDRAVKTFFAAHEGKTVSLQQGGERWEGELPRVRRVTRRAVRAGGGEVAANPRARSAKLRVVERI